MSKLVNGLKYSFQLYMMLIIIYESVNFLFIFSVCAYLKKKNLI
jgi:hypothetical protein